jgi:hypothetical protein
VKENGQKVDVAVLKRGTNTILFKPDAGQELGIVFYVPPGCPKPFKNMALAGYEDGFARWALVCDRPDGACFTGPSQGNACVGVAHYYKTDQVLAGVTCDAGIIIEQ